MLSYWVANYLVDILRSFIPIIVAIIFYKVFDSNIPDAWVLFVVFCFAIHPFTYATSFIFKKEGTAQTVTVLIHIFLGGIAAITCLTLSSFPSTKDYGNVAKWILKLQPSFCVIYGIVAISFRELFARIQGKEEVPAPLSFEVAGADLMFLVINIFFWLFVLYLIETGKCNCKCLRRRGGSDEVEEGNMRKSEVV